MSVNGSTSPGSSPAVSGGGPLPSRDFMRETGVAAIAFGLICVAISAIKNKVIPLIERKISERNQAELAQHEAECAPAKDFFARPTKSSSVIVPKSSLPSQEEEFSVMQGETAEKGGSVASEVRLGSLKVTMVESAPKEKSVAEPIKVNLAAKDSVADLMREKEQTSKKESLAETSQTNAPIAADKEVSPKTVSPI